MILPSIMPDEWAAGYLGRAARMNLVRSFSALQRWIHSVQDAFHVDVKGEPFIHSIAKLSGMAREVFYAQHTLLPLTYAVQPIDKCHSHALISGKQVAEAHLVPRVWFSRLCPECVREDLPYWGFSYWRKSHQFHGVVCCAKHEVGLRDDYSVKWHEEPQDVLDRSTAVEAAIVSDALSNPVIRRYEEICGALAMRARPVSTNQMVRVICLQFAKAAPYDAGVVADLAAFVNTKVAGPWDERFFHSAGSSSINSMTQLLPATTHSVKYALALAALFESSADAVSSLDNVSLDGTPLGQGDIPLQNALHSERQNVPDSEHAMMAALGQLVRGFTLAEAAASQGVPVEKLETVLLSVALPHLRHLAHAV
nr:TniQ family protein [uncultured Albidiferax sp.]